MDHLRAVLSRITLKYYLLAMLLFACVRAADLPYRFSDGIIWSDSEGYYLYLPALFINGGFEDLDVRTEIQLPVMEGTNKRFTKYTSGVAMLELPFFLVAHQLSKWSGKKADGYSAYYIYSIQIAALFYGFLALWLLIRILRRHFSPWVVMLTIMGLFFGTNLYHYMIQEPGMSHVYTFFLFSLFVYWTPRFYTHPGWKMAAVMGLLLGLITLIRPTNIVIVLYLLLYNITSREALNERVQFIRRHFLALLAAPAASFLVFVPQFAYWHYMSGHWLMYSYGDEGFTFWNNPQIDEVLFSIKNGWLRFSPLAALGLIGCIAGSWMNKLNIRTISLIIMITIYVSSSWWCWWFGGAFGHRTFVEYYVVLAIPLAFLSQQILYKSYLLLKVEYLLLYLLLMYYSFVLNVQFTGPHYEWWEWKQSLEWMLHPRLNLGG
jgi:hypothetical protein